MPPRAVKRGGGSGGKKTQVKGPRGKAAARAAAAAAAAAAEEAARAEEAVQQQEEEVTVTTVVETKEEDVVAEKIKVEEIVAEKKSTFEEPDTHGGPADSQDDVKEADEEGERGERLEFEDNEPEYEEETAVDYGEQDMEHADDIQDMEGDEAEEDFEEGDMVVEEEAELADEEVEEGGEDVEDEDGEGEEERHEEDVEEEEHHDVVKEHRKRKEFEVFVGGLDKDATEDDLRKVFSAAGEITEVRLMMNPLTKKNKGFAFLRFATVEQAKRAVSELKAPMVNGKQCGVAPSQDSDTLFLGNICKTWTKDHLKEKLKNFGIENIEDLTLVEDTNNDGMNRGFAFLEFSSRSEAMDAFRRLQKSDVYLGTDRNAKVSLADSFIEPDDEIMAQVTTVFIDGLPAAWDEERVKEYLKKFGQIEKIELARNMPSAKRKDFGFVTFDTHDNAVACAEGINNKELGEGDRKVKVRARLSRPHQKSRGKRGIRGDIRIGRGALRGGPASYSRPPPPRRFPGRPLRPSSGHDMLIGVRGFKRPIPYREKRPYMSVPERPRRLPPPSDRFYERRPPPVPVYRKSSSKREYSRRDEPPLRSRPVTDYASRMPVDRRSAYREEYTARRPSYTDVVSHNAHRAPDRRAYAEEMYGQKLARPPPSYREGRSRGYDSLSGSKRPYSELDDVPPRYADVGVRQPRSRMDYSSSGGSSQYSDPYGDSRLGRSHMEYESSRSLSNQDGLYSSRQGMSYGGGSVGGSEGGGMYSSNYSSSYLPRGSDVGGSSYSSVYSGRNASGGSGYLGGRGSGSYY